MSNVFKKHNGTAQAETAKTATGVIIGFGAEAYCLALQAVAAILKD